MKNRQLENIKKRAFRELKKVKLNANTLEWNRLITYLDYLNGVSTMNCVYGLMTQNCHSDRALELIKLCSTSPYFYDPTAKKANKKSLGRTKSSSRNYTALEEVLYYDKPWVVKKIKELDEK